MCSIFSNKYRIETCRLRDHNYSSSGKYFITICTSGKVMWFGNILNHKMILSESGQTAKKIWHELPEHFSFVSLDEFVVMPDHIHGILIIDPGTDIQPLHAMDVEFATHVETLHATSLPRNIKKNYMSSISPKPGSLGAAIRSFKSAVSKNVHMIDRDFSWQPRYYDHLIRSDTELERIRKYIIDNPYKWDG